MKVNRIILLLTVLTIFAGHLCAQVSIRDSSVFVSLVQPTFAIHFPGGDLPERYGANFTIGGSLMFKTKKNFLAGIDANFIFGGNVKNEGAILDGISTSQGWVIDYYGSPANIFFYERGFSFIAKAGKMFPVIGPNPNSGLFFTTGIGYLQHKTRIENIEKSVPEIQGDYKKGYDRLCGGIALNEFFGYMNLSDHKLINYTIGIELYQAWTASLRPYDFNLMGKDDTKRLDLFFGMKIGWIVPLYQKAPDEYYFY